MAFDGYIQVGGVEIVNVDRTSRYAENSGNGALIARANPAPLLHVAIDDAVYTDPITDDAPWANSADPATSGFYGLYPLEILGIGDSTIIASQTESIGNGGSTGFSRDATRQVKVHGILIGDSELAVEAGLAWLRAAVRTNQCGLHDTGCGATDMTYFLQYPDVAPDELEPYERNYHQVSVLTGPTVLARYRRRCGAAIEVEILFGVDDPFSYSNDRDIAFTPDAPDLFQDPVLTGDFNLVPNPSLETDTVGWSALTGGGAVSLTAQTSSTTPFGHKVAKFSWTTAATVAGGGGQAPDIAVTAGGVFSFGFEIARPSSKIGLKMQVEWRTASTTISTVDSSTQLSGAGATHTFRMEGLTAPAGAVVARMRVISATSGGTSTHWGKSSYLYLDAAHANPGPSLFPYFDGNSIDDLNYTYAWTGTANDSTSVRNIVTVDPLADPDCVAPPSPPRPPVINDECIEDIDLWERYRVTIPAADVAEWADSVPTLTLTTRTDEIRQVRVRFHPNPFGWDPEAVDPTDYCGEFVLSFLPANTQLVMNGMMERAWASVAGTEQRAADQLLYGTGGGPMVWPALSCGIEYVMTVDIPPTADIDNLDIALVLNRRE